MSSWASADQLDATVLGAARKLGFNRAVTSELSTLPLGRSPWLFAPAAEVVTWEF